MAKFKIAPTETVKHDGIVYMEGELIDLTPAQAKTLLESKTILEGIQKVGKKDEGEDEAKPQKAPKKKTKKASKPPKAEAAPAAGA